MNNETTGKRAPILIEIDEDASTAKRTSPAHETREESGRAEPNPADAPVIDEIDAPLPRPRTMEMVTRLVGRPPSKLTRLFINSGVALFTFLLSIAALDYINGLLASYPLLGWIAVALFVIFSIATLGLAWREYRAWSRFAKIDSMQREAGVALNEGSIEKAQHVTEQLLKLYHGRQTLQWGRQRVTDHRAEIFEPRSLLTLTESELLAPLDQEARREIEAAARTVAAATALIPLAFADVAAALAANLRMIRRIAEIYGGRAGTVGGWRLARTVMTHLVATGAVAAGDDLIHTVAGGGVLAKVSRRFGEGIVNGALTARVGIAAMEVCRPLPFLAQPRPSVGNLVARGLRGLFGNEEAKS